MTEAEKNKAARRILAHYRQYQKTADLDRLAKIQQIVNDMGRPFILKIENPPAQVMFRPKLFEPDEKDNFDTALLASQRESV